jgi:hypothetical protein
MIFMLYDKLVSSPGVGAGLKPARLKPLNKRRDLVYSLCAWIINHSKNYALIVDRFDCPAMIIAGKEPISLLFVLRIKFAFLVRLMIASCA